MVIYDLKSTNFARNIKKLAKAIDFKLALC